MNWKTLTFALLTSIGAMTLEAGPLDEVKDYLGMVHKRKPHTIRVLLAHDIEGAMVEVKGSYNIYDPYKGDRKGVRFAGKKMFMQPIQNGIKWGEEFPGVYQIVLVPDHAATTILVNGQQYKGDLYVYQIDNKLNLINEVSVEDYVESTLSSKINEPMELEAMNALAITARTDALYQAAHGGNQFWDIDATKEGYEGFSVVGRVPGVHHAVALTKGMILRGYNGPFAAKWTENSAGITSNYETIYRREAGGPARGVKTVFAEVDRDQAKWSTSISRKEMADILGLDDVTGIDLYHDQETGKVYAAKVKGKTKAREINFLALQDELGADIVQSSDFKATMNQNSIEFTGYGKGAGVGLCLYSAHKMAEKGEDASQILDQFFPEAQISLVPVPEERRYKKTIR